jgi:biotin operon repressor
MSAGAINPIAAIPRQLLALLQTAEGEFLRGQFIIAKLGIDMAHLPNMVSALRRARPDLAIEGRQGKGFRLVSAKPNAPTALQVAAATPTIAANGKPHHTTGRGRVPGDSLHQRFAANLAMLDLLPAASVEIVKTISMESGETAEATVARLIAYGCEVHRDLVASGQNPLALRSAK